MSAHRDKVESHELLPARKERDVEAVDCFRDDDSDDGASSIASVDDGDDDIEQGHAYEAGGGEGAAGGKRSLARGDSPYSWKRSRRFLAGIASAVFFVGLVIVAAVHPVPRDVMRHTWHRLPFTRPPSSKQQDLMNSMPRVERNSSVSLKDFLEARFDPATTNIMWTMATGASPSYVPNARNWDLKRAELGMTDSVVILCLDYDCLDECERTGLRAHAAYLKDENVIPPPSQRLAKRGAERGHVLAYLKFKAMLDMAKTGYYSLFFEGDTFLTADPFDHMLSREDDSWDVQFTVDWGYLLNFGFIYARGSPETVSFYQHAYDQYVAHNLWDVGRIFLSPDRGDERLADHAALFSKSSCLIWSARSGAANGTANPATSPGGCATRSACACTCCRCIKCAKFRTFVSARTGSLTRIPTVLGDPHLGSRLVVRLFPRMQRRPTRLIPSVLTATYRLILLSQ